MRLDNTINALIIYIEMPGKTSSHMSSNNQFSQINIIKRNVFQDCDIVQFTWFTESIIIKSKLLINVEIDKMG